MPVRYQINGATSAAISASVESGVRTGELPAGAPLPAVRALADELGVSPGTVAKAYQVLRQRGVIETAGRNGTRIRPRPPVTTTRAALRPAVPEGALDLSSGEPDRSLLPPLGPHLAALAARVGPPMGYAEAGVLPELAETIRARFAADGVDAPAVTVTSGALDGAERLLTAHLRPGDAVAVEDPGWANFLDLVAALGLRALPVPVDGDGPTPHGLRAALAAGARAVVVTTRAHNPTGTYLTAARAADLREVLAGQDGVLLIEDDHAGELAAVPLHPLAGATRAWAFLRSAAKPYGADLRLAALGGDEATVARVAGRMRLGAGWVSTMLQRLAMSLWQDPAVAAGVVAAGHSYDRRRDTLVAALAERGVTACGRTGINVWIPVADETRAVTMLRDSGYAVAPGALYRQATPPGVRITVSPLAEPDIPPLADAVAAAASSPPEWGRTVR
ncbi:aminotransferase class I/II-fold pyridoxal phosphate-dependent enzyme [Phytohabitans sp. ZYX-F-186]|uniref:Aminotransferase class I/II-fold pyridoxal phosphate-dependent enzyme n=1 Tax=Phytohabitans maris TaxID=3071409 RepID=A0ABU0ZHD1_9ACTN|nr:aminotransferase class I/II-fold pyridoxal phosphate-dependent enzyme [Phytohabitans sp. ZYX-F-186]MDQ7906447.1 aminotransferase class I/II-fold pyridoxal phosphate-dependent enzyme [Phytohabitans sp. ZYX-F-186]